MSWYNKAMSNGHCVGCGADTSRVHEYYMLNHNVWEQTGVARDGGELCIGCVEKRLGRRLTPGDFQDIPMNFQRKYFGEDMQPIQSARLKNRLYGDPIT